MEIEFKMPDLATTDSEIKVIRWIVGVGEPVKRGQPLLEVETDKAAMEVESIATGILKAARAAVGEAIIAGQVIAVIETADVAPKPAPVVAPASPAPFTPSGLDAQGISSSSTSISGRSSVISSNI